MVTTGALAQVAFETKLATIACLAHVLLLSCMKTSIIMHLNGIVQYSFLEFSTVAETTANA